MSAVVIFVWAVYNFANSKGTILCADGNVSRRHKFTRYVRDSDLHVIERSLWRAGHMSGLHLQLDETRVSSYFQSIKPAHSAHARTCSLQRSITALLASKKSER